MDEATPDDVVTGGGAVRIDRDGIVAAGTDAATFLQGQLSQEIEALEVGGSVWSFVLQPQGRIDALVRVSRRSDDNFLIDVDAGFGDQVVERLERFLLRVDCTLEAVEVECVAVRGRSAVEPDVPHDGVVGAVDWPGVDGVDLVGPSVDMPESIRAMSLAVYEQLRIRAGWPVMGREMTDRTMPAETGLVDRTVSFTKGCYVGQELVARVDSRGGNVPRSLRGIVIEGGELPPEGATVIAGADATEVGVLTSSGEDGQGGALALAYIHRTADVPGDATVRHDGVEVSARIVELPIPAP